MPTIFWIIMALMAIVIVPPIIANIFSAIVDRLFDEPPSIPRTWIARLCIASGVIFLLLGETHHLVTDSKVLARSYGVGDSLYLLLIGAILLVIGFFSLRHD
jgi:hypothetical protein